MWRGLPTTGKWTFYERKGVANVWRDMNFISAGAEAKELLDFLAVALHNHGMTSNIGLECSYVAFMPLLMAILQPTSSSAFGPNR